LEKLQLDQLKKAVAVIVNIDAKLSDLKGRAPLAAKEVANHAKHFITKADVQLLPFMKTSLAALVKVTKDIVLAQKSVKEIGNIMKDKKTATLPLADVKKKILATQASFQAVADQSSIATVNGRRFYNNGEFTALTAFVGYTDAFNSRWLEFTNGIHKVK